MTGALDSGRQFALLACRTMRLAARQDLAPLVEAHFETLDVLVIDHFIVREHRLLAATASATSAWTGIPIPAIARWSRGTVPSSALSEARSLGGSAPGRLVRLLVVHI